MGGLDPATNNAPLGGAPGNLCATQGPTSVVDSAATRIDEAQSGSIFSTEASGQTQAFAREALALGDAAPDLVAQLADQDLVQALGYASVAALQGELDAGTITSLEFDAAVTAIAGAFERVLTDGDIVDGATGRLTEGARDALVAALGNDAAIVSQLFSDTDHFISDTILGAVYANNEIAGDARDVLRQIEESQ